MNLNWLLRWVRGRSSPQLFLINQCLGQPLSASIRTKGTKNIVERKFFAFKSDLLLGSFDTICSLGPDATTTLGSQPTCDGVPSADAAPPTRAAAEHQRAAQTAVAAAQHAGAFVTFMNVQVYTIQSAASLLGTVNLM